MSVLYQLGMLKEDRPDFFSSRFRTVLHALWLKLLNVLISLSPSDLCTGSRLMNALNCEYQLLSLTYKVLTTSQPDYLHNLIHVQSSGRTRSSSAVTLARQSVPGTFLITIHQPLFKICITSPVELAPFFIPSTSFCSLSSWFASSCAYHLITVITLSLTIYHSLQT